jgi:hypothetical protein
MSRHFAAYFAIVGTLAFAPGGAANAGQFNIPHFNIPRAFAPAGAGQPHPYIPRPNFSVPKGGSFIGIQKQAVGASSPTVSGSASAKGGGRKIMRDQVRVLSGTANSTVSPSGTASAMPVSNTGGGSLSANPGGGSLSANPGGGPPTSRFRVIEVTRGRFAVVEGRGENILAAGFESSKAAWAWIANHV